VWDAVDAWRWIPPGSKLVSEKGIDIAVTQGSYALTYVYGFTAENGSIADHLLDDIRERIRSLGGSGARLQVTSRTRPEDLVERLQRHGYVPLEEAEVLVWDLLDPLGKPRIPDFLPSTGITVREVITDEDYDAFLELSNTIFGDPTPPPETLRKFKDEFHRGLRENGHSDRYLAWDGNLPVGRAGMELVGPVSRYWGTGVLEQHRRRGIYGALVRARCEASAGRGAEIALVSARLRTSGPILKHHGFRPLGSVRIFEARW
jgi:hypothetical protein